MQPPPWPKAKYDVIPHTVRQLPRSLQLLNAACPAFIHNPQNIPLTKSHRIFRNLPPRTRLGVGLAFLVWGTAGLFLSDSAERKLGFEASEKDRAALESMVPKITVVEREELDRNKREGDR
jgi:hypothetical protein